MAKYYRIIIIILNVFILALCTYSCGVTPTDHVEDCEVVLEDNTVLFKYSNMGSYAIQSLANYTSAVYVTPNIKVNGYNIKTIWETAIIGNTSIKTMVVQDNIESMEFDLYHEFSSLESIFIGAGMKTVQEGIFFKCPNLKQVTVDVRNTTYYSENNAIIEKETGRIVAACSGTCEIPTSAEIIGVNSFHRTSNKTIMIPDNIKQVETCAFQNCAGLIAVYIPKSVHAIQADAFLNCEGVTIYCEAEQKPEDWDDNWCETVANEVHWGVTREEYPYHS